VTLPAEIPVVFLLPGLGDRDPELVKFWEPASDVLQVVPITYLDWSELVQPGSDFFTLISYVKRQIEAHTPSGPVRLAGYSIGGHLAYACALAFHEEGRVVSCMVLLDSPANIDEFMPPLGERLRARLEQFLSFDLRAGLASIVAKYLVTERGLPRLRRMISSRQRSLPFHFERYLHSKVTMQLLMRIFPAWWSTRANPVSRLPVPTVLFRSEEHQPVERRDLGWGDYCQNLKVIRVVGTHRGMLDPEVSGPLLAGVVSAMTAPDVPMNSDGNVAGLRQK
jgi:thioesterase domain-containing protein